MKPQPLQAFFYVLALAGCQGSNAKLLGGNYYLNDSDPAHVYVSKKAMGQGKVVVDQQVVDFEILRDYLLVLRKVAESPDCYDVTGTPTIITHYSNQDEYWVISLDSEREIGPLIEQEYLELLQKLELPKVVLSAPETYRPNTDTFFEWVKKCERLIR